jgi:hypothetical protein
MSWIDVGEVACQVERRHGHADAALIVRRLRAAARNAVLYTRDPELLEREVGCRTRDLRRR